MFKKFKAFEAPHSYNFRDPDTQAPFITATKQELINQVTRLNELYSCLTEAGKEHIDLWAEDHDRSNFKFYLEKR